MEQRNNYKVVYGLEDIFTCADVTNALQFALNLHLSSNIGHQIFVMEDEQTILTLKRPD